MDEKAVAGRFPLCEISAMHTVGNFRAGCIALEEARENIFCAPLLCAEFCYMLWLTELHTSRENWKGAQNVKNLEDLPVAHYATSRIEMIVVSCMKEYLCRMEPEEALRHLSEIIKPKVVKLNEGCVPLPVQSIIEGAKFAAFIDEVLAETIKELEQWHCVSEREIEVLKNIKGKVFIQSMSVDVIQFIADAYRGLKY